MAQENVSPSNTAKRTSGQLLERRLHRVRSSAAERRGADRAMRPGSRAVCCGSPAQAQPVGRRPRAGRQASPRRGARRRSGSAAADEGTEPRAELGPRGWAGRAELAAGVECAQAQRWRAGCNASRMTARSNTEKERAIGSTGTCHAAHYATCLAATRSMNPSRSISQARCAGV